MRTGISVAQLGLGIGSEALGTLLQDGRKGGVITSPLHTVGAAGSPRRLESAVGQILERLDAGVVIDDNLGQVLGVALAVAAVIGARQPRARLMVVRQRLPVLPLGAGYVSPLCALENDAGFAREGKGI